MQISRDSRPLLAALAIVSIAGASSSAGYVSVTPSIQIIAPPPSVQVGDLQSNTLIRTFAERQSLTLANALAVDQQAPGSFSDPSSLTGGTIAAGLKVDSYFFHSDPKQPDTIFDGSVTFSTKILGVIVLSETLDSTDALLGAPGTAYPNGVNARGLELGANRDSFILSADLRTLTFHFRTESVVDEVRVVTAAVPEPASAVLLGLGGPCLLGLARLRRRRAAR